MHDQIRTELQGTVAQRHNIPSDMLCMIGVTLHPKMSSVLFANRANHAAGRMG